MSERWSYSRFTIADACLKLFELRYEVPKSKRIPQLYHDLREGGKTIHRCIEVYKEHLQSTGMEQDLEMISMIVEDVFSNDPEITSTAHYNDVLLVFKLFAKQYRHNPKTYLGSELLIERELPETDVIITGFPDQIETGMDDEGDIIVSDDIKSGYSTSVTSDNEFQGEISSWMLMPQFEGERIGWRVSWPRAGTQSPITEFKPTFVQALEARMRSIIARVANARLNNKWPATPSSACAHCPIAAKCRERNVLAKNSGIVSTQAEAEKAAADFVILDGAFDQRRAQLADWTNEHGHIKVGDVVLGYFESGGETFKIGDIDLMIMRLGLLALVADGTFASEKDPIVKTKDGQNLIAAAGVQIAIQEKLITVNGSKTKNKGVQDDPRLHGLWTPSDIKTQFGINKPKPKSKRGKA